MDKIYNVVILGPSSSGKTSVAQYLATKYRGVRISLDGETANGRPINSVVKMTETKKFTKEEVGVLFRSLMIKEAKSATAAGLPWMIDDIDPLIWDIMPPKLKNQSKLIIIIPTIDKIVKNVIQRNKLAEVAPEERKIANVLRQLRTFVAPRPIRTVDLEKAKKQKGRYIISNLDIINACEHDKMHYSLSEQKAWEEETNEVLAKFYFKPMKYKKISYMELIPYNYGQNSVVLNVSGLANLYKYFENHIKR